MEKFSFTNDSTFHSVFHKIQSMNMWSPYISEIINLICENDLSKINLDGVLSNYTLNIHNIKLELIDLVLTYLSFVLDDHVISDVEKNNAELLKLLFEIKEGDFYNFRSFEIARIIKRQYEYHVVDRIVSEEEEIQEFLLQDIFDMGYDQFNKLEKL